MVQVEPFPVIVQIQYSNAPPSFNFFDSDVRAWFGHKSKGWCHEKEWRLVWARPPGLFRVPQELIRGVVLGLRAPERVRNSVREIALEMDLELYKMEPVKGTYSVSMSRIR